MPGEPFYDKLVADNGSDEYAKTDIELSKKTAGRRRHQHGDADRRAAALRRPEPAAGQRVRADPRTPSPRPGSTWSTAGDINWSPNLPNTSLYDAALFGWQTTAVAVADSMPNYVTDGVNNFYGYSNADVDALSDRAERDVGRRPRRTRS